MVSKRYIPELDGLRGIAIIGVLLTHYGMGLSFGGKFGVTLFFFISGLLITQLLITEYNKNKHINLKLFYIRRVLRLYPALIFMNIVAITAAKLMGCGLKAEEIFASLFYFINYYMAYFGATSGGCSAMLNPLWSLAVEEHFYLLYPLIFLGLYKNKNRLFIGLGLLVAAALIWRSIIVFYLTVDQTAVNFNNYILTETRFDSILYGCLVSLLLNSRHKTKLLAITSQPILFFAAVVLLYISFKVNNFLFSQRAAIFHTGFMYQCYHPAFIV